MTGPAAQGLWPPAHGPEFLAGLARPLAETVAIAVLGMALAVAAGLPLALAATSGDVLAACGRAPSPATRAVRAAARLLLDVWRSIPEVVWALLFVRGVGIGAPAGVLAIGISYAGILGKVFSEIFESAPRGAAEALAAAGATPFHAFALGIAPAARPVLVSYTLYRFDCALRASAVLGLVGAGGIGQQLELSLKMLAYDEVAAYVLALFALVAAVDLASVRVRRRLDASASLFPASWGAAARAGAVLLAGALALAASARILGVSPADLSTDALRQMGAYARQLFPPELSASLLRALAPAAAETLAVSVLGTAIAAAAGIVLAYLASPRLGALEPVGRGDRSARGARLILAALARAVLNLGRTLPELLWAIVFILAVGLGPFAGALALGVHTAGVLGRLYAEVLEEVPAAPLTALRAAGAGRFSIFVSAALPQAFPQLCAYTLYRWDVNIRASAVLGVVGAGGIGRLLHVSMSLFDYGRTCTLLLAILALVTAVDAASGAIRRRLLAGMAPPERTATASAELAGAEAGA